MRADEPGGPWFSQTPFGAWLTLGWSGDLREVWLATDDGAAAGWYRIEMPTRENLDQVGLDLMVHPAERRRGLGLALLRHAAARAAEHGRTVLNGGVRHGTPGEAFSHSVGAKSSLLEIQRVLDVSRVDQGALARLRGPAERAAAGYSLVSWAGPVPEEFIEQAAAVYAGMNDAPRDPDFAAEDWDAQRVREQVNALRPDFGMRTYTVAARHDSSGELGGADRGLGGPGRPGLGAPAGHGRDQEAPRAPARHAAEDRDDGVPRHRRAAARADLDLERPGQRAHDRDQRGDRLRRLPAAGHLGTGSMVAAGAPETAG